MKKVLKVSLIIFSIVIAYFSWKALGPTLRKPAAGYFFIHTGDDFEKISQSLVSQGITKDAFMLNLVAVLLRYKKNIKPGMYEIPKNASIVGLIKLLRSGKQTPIKVTINKWRTRSEFAGKMGKKFEVDSLTIQKFICSNDSLKAFQLDTNSFMSIIIPNTYQFFWDASVPKIIKRLQQQQNLFWNSQRQKQAKNLNLTPYQVYVIASIVEEETNMDKDKGLIASVYLNRIKKGMPLQADPTVKFSMGDFSITRVLQKHLEVESPYNTYKISGIPPGPICTPSIATIDAVLNAPTSNYLYFVAKEDFSGYSYFSTTYEEHLNYADRYRRALDQLYKSKKKQ